jgi:ribosomal protein S27E
VKAVAARRWPVGIVSPDIRRSDVRPSSGSSDIIYSVPDAQSSTKLMSAGPQNPVMTDKTDSSGSTDGLDPADAFSLLGDATRLEIVTALHDGSVEPPVRFSTLYDRVEVADSAQFNYHLKRLVPHFVSKVEDGYELTAAGRRLARAVTAGTDTRSPRLDPFEIDGRCYACGATALRASYANERFAIDCRECGEAVLDVRAPPTLVRGRDPEAVVAAFDDWSRMQAEQARRGVCPDCGGPVEPSVTEPDADAIDHELLAAFDCGVCGRRAVTSFGGLAYRHPAVEEFHRERGASLHDRPYWKSASTSRATTSGSSRATRGGSGCRSSPTASSTPEGPSGRPRRGTRNPTTPSLRAGTERTSNRSGRPSRTNWSSAGTNSTTASSPRSTGGPCC